MENRSTFSCFSSRASLCLISTMDSSSSLSPVESRRWRIMLALLPLPIPPPPFSATVTVVVQSEPAASAARVSRAASIFSSPARLALKTPPAASVTVSLNVAFFRVFCGCCCGDEGRVEEEETVEVVAEEGCCTLNPAASSPSSSVVVTCRGENMSITAERTAGEGSG